jgi:hypothetical protein
MAARSKLDRGKGRIQGQNTRLLARQVAKGRRGESDPPERKGRMGETETETGQTCTLSFASGKMASRQYRHF